MRGVLSSGGKPGKYLGLNSGVRPANVWLLRLKVLSRTWLEFVWRDLQRDEVTRSCGEVNELIKGLSAKFRHPSISRMVICPDASTAQNYIAAVSAPFDELGRQHGLGLDPPLELLVQSVMAGSVEPRSHSTCGSIST